jgi:hypothetical protein
MSGWNTEDFLEGGATCHKDGWVISYKLLCKGAHFWDKQRYFRSDSSRWWKPVSTPTIIRKIKEISATVNIYLGVISTSNINLGRMILFSESLTATACETDACTTIQNRFVDKGIKFSLRVQDREGINSGFHTHINPQPHATSSHSVVQRHTLAVKAIQPYLWEVFREINIFNHIVTWC